MKTKLFIALFLGLLSSGTVIADHDVCGVIISPESCNQIARR